LKSFILFHPLPRIKYEAGSNPPPSRGRGSGLSVQALFIRYGFNVLLADVFSTGSGGSNIFMMFSASEELSINGYLFCEETAG